MGKAFAQQHELGDKGDGNGVSTYQRTPLTEVQAFDVGALRDELLNAMREGAQR